MPPPSRFPRTSHPPLFFLVAATVCPNSRLILQNVGINPGRTGIIDILRAMGGNIKTPEARHYGSEPVTDLEVQTARLKGIRINKELVPAAIDELPIVMIAAACAEGETTIEDAQELRVKESNRLAVMIAGLKRLGVRAKETADGAIIRGNPRCPFSRRRSGFARRPSHCNVVFCRRLCRLGRRPSSQLCFHRHLLSQFQKMRRTHRPAHYPITRIGRTA